MAFPSLTLVRGNTYYLAGDATSYGSKNYPSTTGSSLITVKKATASDHVTETGWSASYGTTPATFSGGDVAMSYLTIDGQVGGGPTA